ncbi:MAG: dihydroxyacetone kinase family protein [Actinomycetes bacterium]
MAYLINDASEFVDEMTEGFVAAYSHLVRSVYGGVVRAQATPADRVAIVIGGGSGHYPAFSGVVGPGLAHGSAMGNVFASPSAQQIYNVCKSAAGKSGVFMSYGNYAGDVMNFNQAQDRLISEGIPCKTVVVTDDIMSASKSEIHKRRGIAGDLTVFKIAGAASDAGYSLDEVVRVATEANNRTRTIGVAFSGCTLPGADHPLFTVPEGIMALGLGIHGEPGLSEAPIPTANDLAEDLVRRLLDETPSGCSNDGARIVVLLNGLGGVKYEELFVVYRSVSKLLKEKNIVIVEPEVGELVTSFEMAGASLTFTWLNEELETLWAAPAYTPAFKKGSVQLTGSDGSFGGTEILEEVIPHASEESISCATSLERVIASIDATITKNEAHLGQLDSYAGDGDHGIGMARGTHAALTSAKKFVALKAGAGTLLEKAGDSWADRAGGTSGAIWGIILREIGKELGNSERPTPQVVAKSIVRASNEVMSFGKAQLGDKTLVDALIPFAQTLESEILAGKNLGDAWESAARASAAAAESTSTLLPKIGRARPHAEKSVGHPDPGAISFSMITSDLSALIREIA